MFIVSPKAGGHAHAYPNPPWQLTGFHYPYRWTSKKSSPGMQRGNIDLFIAQAVNSPNWDRHMAAAMFELLIPNRLKTFSPDLRHMVLVLDERIVGSLYSGNSISIRPAGRL